MSVPRYPNETAAEPVHPDVVQADLDAGPGCGTCLGTGLVGTGTPYDVNPCPDCAVHPVDALVDVTAQMYPGQEMNPEHVAIGRAICDEPVDVVPSAQDAINEMVENGWLPDALVRHLRLLGPELELWSPRPGFPRHSGLFMLSAATAIENQTRLIADLEAKLDAERTLRAQGAAELEREKAHERDRRIQAESRARDALWALDAAIEALAPLAGYATEEDGRVAGMTAPVCLAMSSVRRADAMVKLHRALRR